MIKHIILYLILIGILFHFPLKAQDETDSVYKNQFIPLPFASYSPETRLMFGGLLVYQFKPKNAHHETRASQILTSAIYTLNQQIIFEVIPIIILKDENWLLEGILQYQYFPNNYWGIGPNAQDEDLVNIQYRQFNFRQGAFKKIGEGLYLGPMLRWTRLSDFELENLNNMPIKEIPGDEGSSLTGLGFSIRWDKRNSITAPTSNHFVDLSAFYYSRFLGTTHPHLQVQLDGRKYFDLNGNKKRILALHGRIRVTEGSLPFQEYSMIGGWEIMRGYFMGRFRDFNALQVQAELRQHLYGRFGLAAFIATGEVWDNHWNISFSNPKYAGGLGIRFNINPKDTNNIRLDYGIGRHDRGLYIKISEAF